MHRASLLYSLVLLSAVIDPLSVMAQGSDELQGLRAQLERLQREKEELQSQISNSPTIPEKENGSYSPGDPFARFLEEGKNTDSALENGRDENDEIIFEEFGRPDIIQVLHTGNIATLNASPFRSLVYISNLSTKLSDQSTLFLIEDPSIILTTVDPTVSTRAMQKLASSQRGMQELNSAATQSLFSVFGAMADTRRDGGSIQSEIQSMHSAIANSPAAQLEMLAKQAEFDAIKLAYLSQTHPDDFKKIYRGIRNFIRN